MEIFINSLNPSWYQNTLICFIEVSHSEDETIRLFYGYFEKLH